jgi:hypothetical protein
MTAEARLRCRCGEVEGVITDASPRTANRVVCYCDDCQSFAHHLDRADVLDAQGGSDVVQVAPSALRITKGAERITGMRLSPKGLFRWYASCCRTPIGNTLAPKVPFVGIVAHAFEGGAATADAAFGKPVAKILGRYAIGTPPPGSTSLDVRVLIGVVAKVLGWKLRGKTWPHPFFDRTTRAPAYPVTVISREERDALRRHCGPHPTAGSAA